MVFCRKLQGGIKTKLLGGAEGCFWGTGHILFLGLGGVPTMKVFPLGWLFSLTVLFYEIFWIDTIFQNKMFFKWEMKVALTQHTKANHQELTDFLNVTSRNVKYHWNLKKDMVDGSRLDIVEERSTEVDGTPSEFIQKAAGDTEMENTKDRLRDVRGYNKRI